ncbi:MAG: alcohol dehydrogenase class IV [Patiriisocius sp.]
MKVLEVLKANWNYPTRVLVGAGRINEIGTECLARGIKAPLLVTDPGIASLPMTAQVLATCEAAGLKVRCFSHIKPNPTGQNIVEGAASFLQGKHDGVIALGGGSALDAGKSIALIAQQSCALWDLEDIGDNHKNANPEKIAPVIAIPTTAGTGSEVGRAGLIVNEGERRKVIIFHPQMMPVSVILDPEVTLGLPAHLTAATGMDALSHSLEAWCSPGFHPMAEGIALESIRLVRRHLERVVTDGSDVDSRLQMQVASMMGATAFQRGLGAMHALAHPLGALYDAHHGLLNAVLMPYVLTANANVIDAKVGRLAGYIELAPDFDAFMNWVLSLREAIGIPHTLAGVIERDESFDKVGEMAVLDPSAGGNPIQFSADEYQQILRNAFDGIL